MKTFNIKKLAVAGAIAVYGISNLFAIPKVDINYLKQEYQKGDLLFVIGEKAKPIDVVSALDLLSAISVGNIKDVKVSIETEDTTNIGDNVVKLWRDNDKINLGEGFKVSVINENEGTLTIGSTDYNYNVYVKLNQDKEAFQFKYGKPNTDKDPEFYGDISGSDQNEPVAELHIEFEDPVDITDKDGNVNTDAVGEKIVINGKPFFISSLTDGDELVLYGASKKITIEKGKNVTVEVDGKKYTISIVGFSDSGGTTQVVLDVNGDVDSIKEKSSKTIGGLNIYVDTIWTADNNKEGGAVLLLGSKKIVLKDGDKVKVGDNEDPVDGTEVTINKQDTGDNLYGVKEIIIKYYKPDADQDYIDENQSFKDDVFGAFTIEYQKPDLDWKEYSIDRSDTKLEFENVQFAKASGGKILFVNDDDKPIHIVEGQTAGEDDYIVLGTFKTVDGVNIPDETTTALMKVDNIDLDDENGYVELKDVFTGETVKTTEGKFNETGDKLKLFYKGEEYVVELTDSDENNPMIRVYHEGWDKDNDGKIDYWFIPVIKVNNNIEIIPFFGFYNASDGTITVVQNMSAEGFETNYSEGLKDIINPSRSIIFVSPSDSGGALKWIYKKDLFSTTNENVTGILIREPRLEGGSEVWRPVTMVAYDLDSNGDFRYNGVYNTSSDTTTASKVEMYDHEENNDIVSGVDKYGTIFEVNTDSDNGNTRIYHPSEQVYGPFYLLKGEKNKEDNTNFEVITLPKDKDISIEKYVKTMKFLGADLENTESLPIAVLDSEINKYPNRNFYVVIGGPCVNTLAQEFLAGTPYGSCNTWPLQPGEYLIKYAEKGGKTALIIAGTTGEDTRKAIWDFIEGKAKTENTNSTTQ
jgi:hypothetical protein